MSRVLTAFLLMALLLKGLFQSSSQYYTLLNHVMSSTRQNANNSKEAHPHKISLEQNLIVVFHDYHGPNHENIDSVKEKNQHKHNGKHPHHRCVIVNYSNLLEHSDYYSLSLPILQNALNSYYFQDKKPTQVTQSNFRPPIA